MKITSFCIGIILSILILTISCSRNKDVLSPKTKVDHVDKVSTIINPRPNTRDGLQAAINAAGTGDIVQLDSDITFNAGEEAAYIMKEITLDGNEFTINVASNYTTGCVLWFGVNGSTGSHASNSTIQDLTISRTTSNSGISNGIVLSNVDNITIDSCTLINFSTPQANPQSVVAAIHIADCEHAIVKNCTITGGEIFGYGVELTRSDAHIDACTFDSNRHDITGDGSTETSYTATGCTTDNNCAHAFDMHGDAAHNPGQHNHVAGNRIIIEDNEFNDASQYAIVIRGKPLDVCEISGNTFAHSVAESAIRQQKETNTYVVNDADVYGNIKVNENTFGTPPNYTCLWVKHAGSSKYIPLKNLTGWNLSTVAFGDFNGDGITDLFVKQDNQWKIAWNSFNNFFTANGSAVLWANLAFGDFNTDHKTDVISAWSGNFQFSDAAIGAWDDDVLAAGQNLLISDIIVDDIYPDVGGSDILALDNPPDDYKWLEDGCFPWFTTFPYGYDVPGTDPRNLHRLWRDFNGDSNDDNLYSISVAPPS